mmetsp:Transcript_4086/g.9896  ORF Transcript_4086/g.9896 Transcript_4086/m.9896 type:complete len:97 (+) Transcript_4086:87-377(+)
MRRRSGERVSRSSCCCCRRAAAAAAAHSSPPPPTGMAAAARGRFMTQLEYNAMGKQSTDTGLDSLYSTPEFVKWMRSQSHRISLTREDYEGEEDDK